MGRPPIGKQAMSATERSRRHRARLQAQSPSPAQRQQAEIAALKAEIARLKARQPQAATAVRAAGPWWRDHRPRTAAEWDALKAEATAERKAAREARRAAVAEHGAEMVKLREQVAALKGENHSLKMSNRRIAGERDKALRAVHPTLRKMMREHSSLLTRKTYLTLVKAIHPDRTATDQTEATQLLNAIKPLFDLS